MAEDKIGVCSVEQMKEIIEAVKWLKQSGFVTQSGQKKPLLGEIPRLYMAVVTTAITGRSGTTAGKGKATLRAIPGVAGTATTIENFPSGGAAEVDVYNVTTQTVAVGKYITVKRECASGKYIVDLEDCE